MAYKGTLTTGFLGDLGPPAHLGGVQECLASLCLPGELYAP